MTLCIILCTLANSGPIRGPETAPVYRLPSQACGSAAIYLVLRYLNRPASLDDLLAGCRDPRGCSIGELCEMASRAGLSTSVLRLRPRDFPALRSPAIVLRQPPGHEVGHYQLIIPAESGVFLSADPGGCTAVIQPADLKPEELDEPLPTVIVSPEPVITSADNAPASTPGAWPAYLFNGAAIAGALAFSYSVLCKPGRRSHPANSVPSPHATV